MLPRKYVVTCFWSAESVPFRRFGVVSLRAGSPEQAAYAAIIGHALRWTDGGLTYHYDPALAQEALLVVRRGRRHHGFRFADGELHPLGSSWPSEARDAWETIEDYERLRVSAQSYAGWLEG